MGKREKIYNKANSWDYIPASRLVVRERNGTNVLGYRTPLGRWVDIMGFSDRALKIFSNKLVKYVEGDIPTGWEFPTFNNLTGIVVPLVKVTDYNRETGDRYSRMKWGKNMTNTVDTDLLSESPRLCSRDVIHGYQTLNMALFCSSNLTHYHLCKDERSKRNYNYEDDFKPARIYEGEGILQVSDWDKLGCVSIKTTKELKVPNWYKSRTTRVRVFIYAVTSMILDTHIPYLLSIDPNKEDNRIVEYLEKGVEILRSNVKNKKVSESDLKDFVYTSYEIDNWMKKRRNGDFKKKEAHFKYQVISTLKEYLDCFHVCEDGISVIDYYRTRSKMQRVFSSLSEDNTRYSLEDDRGQQEAIKKFLVKERGFDKDSPLNPISYYLDLAITEGVKVVNKK